MVVSSERCLRRGQTEKTPVGNVVTERSDRIYSIDLKSDESAVHGSDLMFSQSEI